MLRKRGSLRSSIFTLMSAAIGANGRWRGGCVRGGISVAFVWTSTYMDMNISIRVLFISVMFVPDLFLCFNNNNNIEHSGFLRVLFEWSIRVFLYYLQVHPIRLFIQQVQECCCCPMHLAWSESLWAFSLCSLGPTDSWTAEVSALMLASLLAFSIF